MLGTVAKWFGDKKFGFIRPDDGSNGVFCHIKQFQEAKLPEPVEGDRVSFEIGEGRNGKQAATNIGKA
jgi:CspA family cold shock protein